MSVTYGSRNVAEAGKYKRLRKFSVQTKRTPVDRTEGHPCYSQKGRNEEEAELLGAAGLFLFPVSPTLRMLLTRFMKIFKMALQFQMADIFKLPNIFQVGKIHFLMQQW
ncbi:hypothetical protein Y1Q_0009859 [Alligator mississippiensis]|uniref:Uncharacterized protein n=1 Tax=Alligator mississippiensis TaxID=8496 RepID=A0A151MX18_ALLMI|nr:hypothetical protein Y1Q_0009859 [Alligator mississippiensis]